MIYESRHRRGRFIFFIIHLLIPLARLASVVRLQKPSRSSPPGSSAPPICLIFPLGMSLFDVRRTMSPHDLRAQAGPPASREPPLRQQKRHTAYFDNNRKN